MLYVNRKFHCPYGQDPRSIFQQRHDLDLAWNSLNPFLKKIIFSFLKDMGFSTPSKLYHGTQIFQKWNKKYFSLRATILACNLSTVHVKRANKINIACPYGHINTLYLRTCTFIRSLSSRRQYFLTLLFSAVCLNVNLCLKKLAGMN